MNGQRQAPGFTANVPPPPPHPSAQDGPQPAAQQIPPSPVVKCEGSRQGPIPDAWIRNDDTIYCPFCGGVVRVQRLVEDGKPVNLVQDHMVGHGKPVVAKTCAACGADPADRPSDSSPPSRPKASMKPDPPPPLAPPHLPVGAEDRGGAATGSDVWQPRSSSADQSKVDTADHPVVQFPVGPAHWSTG